MLIIEYPEPRSVRPIKATAEGPITRFTDAELQLENICLCTKRALRENIPLQEFDL
jgi:hypothetical protein